MKQYLVNTTARCADYRVALAQAEGLPRRATVVGGPDMLPIAYAPGAPGWTDQLCPTPVDAGDGTAALEVPPEGDRHLGKRVRVGAKDVDLPTPAAKVLETDLPQKFRDAAPKDPPDDPKPGTTTAGGK